MALFSNLSLGANLILLVFVIHVIIIMVEKIKKFTIASDKHSIAILVLGDIGRSPRMQRHGQSLITHLNHNHDIHIIGFVDSTIEPSLQNHKRVTLHNIGSLRFPHLLGNNILSFLLYAFLKITSEILSLLYILSSSSIPSPLTHIIMQNPPSIPVVIIAKYVSILRGSTFLIDWHNFGFSILALKRKGLLVQIYKCIERYVGKTADIHLTVTQSMKTFLIKEWRFNPRNIFVLCDRPTEVFLRKTSNKKDDALLWMDIGTHFEGNCIKEAKGDDLWMISSTSWTPDEDLNMLVDENVLKNMDEMIDKRNDDGKRNVVLFITGKDEGELKKEFVRKLNRLSLKYIQVIPLWLQSHDNYVHLLRWCDIGLCFHVSSSGLDLPMKVVDMFGVGIPVIAIEFSQTQMEKIMEISDGNKENIKTALGELVIHNKNGFVFKTSEELTRYVMRVYEDKKKKEINGFKQNIETFRAYKWNDQWKETMQKLPETHSFDFEC